MRVEALLLRRHFLANDDGRLELFTYEKGKIVVFMPKLARSKHRIQYLDFFRFFETFLHATPSGYFRAYQLEELGAFAPFFHTSAGSASLIKILALVRFVAAPEKPLPEYFLLLKTLLTTTTQETFLVDETFFQIKTLQVLGMCPRFDQLRGDVYYCYESGVFATSRKHTNMLYLPHEARQILEFFRRIDWACFQEKKHHPQIQKHINAANIFVSQVLAGIKKLDR